MLRADPEGSTAWEHAALSLDMTRLNVLIVDDSNFMRALLRDILMAFEIRNIRDCGNGEEALALLATWTADIAFVDWFMEPMDGLEFTKTVRGSETAPDPYLPVIMITAEAEQMGVEQALDAGVTELLLKPLSPQSVYASIQSVIERPREFIRKDEYVGPSRRRSINKFTGTEKRTPSRNGR